MEEQIRPSALPRLKPLWRLQLPCSPSLVSFLLKEHEQQESLQAYIIPEPSSNTDKRPSTPGSNPFDVSKSPILHRGLGRQNSLLGRFLVKGSEEEFAGLCSKEEQEGWDRYYEFWAREAVRLADMADGKQFVQAVEELDKEFAHFQTFIGLWTNQEPQDGR